MKKSEILQAAIDKYLWDGNPATQYSSHSNRWLCRCVEKYSNNDATAIEIKKIIQERLYPHDTAAAWLLKVAKIPRYELTYETVQAYRKRWAESLIEEFKAAGD